VIKMPVRKNANSAIVKKLLAQAKRNSIEAQIRAKVKQNHLHPNERKLLAVIIDHVNYMRKHGKTESEIRQHLNDANARHPALIEILEK
jgi:DnaJ-domain-containing protein 1